METLITWDEPKRQMNKAKHGFDFADLTLEFFEAAHIGDSRDNRKFAIGKLDDGTIVAIFAELGTEAISVISMRPASKKEREEYARV
ncbi:BrnT family toxin [Halocynthiibacter sp.]|uniref:BrnT family toxin n=1 Tax=Halocynthiibacter sp. TaxID=1979210 RepID=UPI003C565030